MDAGAWIRHNAHVSLSSLRSLGLSLALLGGAAGVSAQTVDFSKIVRSPPRTTTAPPKTSLADQCSVVPPQVQCRATSGRVVQSGPIDLGYPDGRAWVVFAGKNSYCRVIGNGYPSSFVTCLQFNGTGFGPEIKSSALDWGYPDTRQWRDANGDGLSDFCRVIGNNREMMACTFSTIKGFGQTVTTRR